MEFVKADIPVFSNAKNYRRDPLVPLVVPTVNLPHLDLIPHQRSVHKLNKGFLVCNSNCAVIGLVGPFAALQDRKSTRLNSSHSGESRMPSSA